MDFCRRHSPDEEWTMTHEQYRPFVLFHRTQAEALAALERDDESAELAIHAINQGLDKLRDFFEEHDLDERFEVGRTLHEQLDDAVAAEQYELAARLRDQLNQRHGQSF